ncbi:nuclease-related domain-containing protein [Litchfieldia salsa]|uniref:Nuclease-related domain-containing protein n=1 Tax=Litchfieldia salsa TaxID=930152 RepID=A0A1H0WAV6_9BACI|nr:nuclease-related domain-containing protein [Litchfieldia salsa]SDP87585.1 Nuclease-related domain-containing protein [Litchfieldia salsa]
MILKERDFPLILKKQQALLRRLSPQHKMYPIIMEDLKKREAGFKGETSIDYHLGFLDKDNYWILHDIRLSDQQNRFFQIDTLIVTKTILIPIEIKNIAGTLYFDPIFKQLIRTKDGIESGFRYPLSQIEKQSSQLSAWLKRSNFPEVPIYPIIVISSPQTVIRTTSENRKIAQKVIHNENLPEKIKELTSFHNLDILTE